MHAPAPSTSRLLNAVVDRPPSVWRQTARQLWRDWRGGELRLLMAGLVLAVAAVCAVGFLADRIDGGLRANAAQMLGGDAVIASDQATPTALMELARQSGLAQMRSVSFPSMARAPDEQGSATRLVSVKAVSQDYPLRGHLQLSDGRQVGVPAPGTVWVDAAVLDSLNLNAGDRLLLGDRALRIAGVIASEPDRGAGFMNIAPRVMLAEPDLASTGLVQPASRLNYRFAVAGTPGHDASAFVREAQRRVEAGTWRGVRFESLESGRPDMRQTLDRAGKFLKLVAMLSALLAAVAVSLAARDFANRHLDDCAMLRVLGQSQRRMAWMFGLEMVLAGLVASLLGVLLGFLLHYGFAALLANLIAVPLPAPTAGPACVGLGLGLCLAIGFGLAPVMQLASVPALRVMRRDLGTVRLGSIGVSVAGLLGLGAILVLIAGENLMGLLAALGFAGALLLFGLMTWLAVKGLRRVVPESGAPAWLLLATRQVAARPMHAVVQVSALAVGLLALALLLMLRTDLISGWQQSAPKDAPDRFVINIQPEQGEAFKALLQQQGVRRFDWYPMIRGRLAALNGKAIGPRQFAQERAKQLVEREFNLSYAAAMPEHNQLAAGAWGSEDADGLSVEQGIAETLGLKLGDRLQFDVAGQMLLGRISSLRKVDWASMRVNFFVMFPRGALAVDLPVSYICAYKSPGGSSLDRAMARQFPNVTNVDVSAQLQQVQQVLDQVVRAVQLLFVFTLAMGLIVMLNAISSTRESRRRDFALMRALGAGSELLRRVQRAELLGLGVLAGLLAGVVASALGAALSSYVFEFEPQLNLWIPWLTMACGALLTLGVGWLGLRDVLQRPVMWTLRQAVSD